MSTPHGTPLLGGAAPIATRVSGREPLEPVRVEVADHLTHLIGAGERHLGDRRDIHPLCGERHDLRPPPLVTYTAKVVYRGTRYLLIDPGERQLSRTARRCRIPPATATGQPTMAPDRADVQMTTDIRALDFGN